MVAHLDIATDVSHPGRRHLDREGNVDRTKATRFLIAFLVIGISTVIEGINDGWTALNWIILGVSIFFAGQSLLVLSKRDEPQG
jgi:hypothetical protein